MNYTIADLRKTLTFAWGEEGSACADAFEEFNAKYFNGRIKPAPIFFTPSVALWQMHRVDERKAAAYRPRATSTRRSPAS
jgi:hypothetical protein